MTGPDGEVGEGECSESDRAGRIRMQEKRELTRRKGSGTGTTRKICDQITCSP